MTQNAMVFRIEIRSLNALKTVQEQLLAAFKAIL